MTVASQLLITNHRGELPAYADEELAMPSMQGSNLLRGVADDAVGTALLAVTNIDPSPQRVTLRCISEEREYSPATINVAANATSLVSNCSGDTVNDLASYLNRLSGHTDQVVKGYELVNDGLPGTIAAFGLAPHKHNDDTALSAIPFTDPGLIRASDIVFAGVPFGPQTALPDGVYTPRISFTNFSNSPAHVTVSIATTPQNQSSSASAEPGNSPELRPLQQLTLPARRTTEFVLQDAESQSGLLQSLVIHTDAKPGDVMSKVVSRSDGNLYEIELLGKDRWDENNGGIHPWTVEQDFVSHLLLFNYSDKPRTFGVGIWNGAILWDKKFTLAPKETREISFNQLIQDKVKDDKGQILDANHRRGVVNWMVPDSGEGTGRLMVTSRSQAMARNFSCGEYIVVCGSRVWANWELVPINSILMAGYTAEPQFCDEFSPSQCTGGSQVSNGSANYNWSIGASTVIKPNTSSDQYAQSPNIYGVGPGTGSGYVEVTGGGCQSGGGGGPLEVLAITSISPSNIPVNDNGVKVTISGSGFGTSPTLNLPTGVTSTGQTSSDTQIVVTLIAGNSATVGNGTISVTASKQTSNTKPVILDGPYQMEVTSDISFYCQGCSDIQRSVTYQAKNFSGSSAGASTFCELPSITNWNCDQSQPTVSAKFCPNNGYDSYDGTFEDTWTLNPSILTPAGCGANITDPWYWAYTSPNTPIGTPAGYVHTNAVEIDGVTTPNQLPNGTIMPK